MAPRPLSPPARSVARLAAAAPLLLAVACGGSGSSGSTHAMAAATATPTIVGTTQVFTLDGGDDLMWSPKVLLAHPGTITLHVHTSGQTPHSFTGDAPLPTIDYLAAGQTKDVTFTVTKPGTYHFVCTFHAPGMAGELVVS
ncbi:MAG: blue (type 1) copper domain protein [Mycobacterium sp.]|jgi:VCBS repeat-containing protein|nr:blue (type 1) copper domain protein [Mycobacterium sp.]